MLGFHSPTAYEYASEYGLKVELQHSVYTSTAFGPTIASILKIQKIIQMSVISRSRGAFIRITPRSFAVLTQENFCMRLLMFVNVGQRSLYSTLAGLPGFARDSCRIIMSICAFHFYRNYFHFFLCRSWHFSNF